MKVYLCLLVLALVALAYGAEEDQTDMAFQLYNECSAHNEGLSPCLKKKAITFVDRLARMDHLTFLDAIQVNRAENSVIEPAVTEEQLDASLPRAIDAKDEILSSMLWDRVGKFIESRSIEVALPKITDLVEEGRKGESGGGFGGGGGGGGGKDKKGGGMMKGMMMAIMAKMAALIPIAIAGLFLLAKKALITAKIALLISGIIFIKKLFASKQHQSHGHGGGWSSGSGGWQSSGGGGWDKRSIEQESAAQKMAYKAYNPQ